MFCKGMAPYQFLREGLVFRKDGGYQDFELGALACAKLHKPRLNRHPFRGGVYVVSI